MIMRLKSLLPSILFAIIIAFASTSFAQKPNDLNVKIYPSEVKDFQFYINSDEFLDENNFDLKVINLIGSEIPFTLHKMLDGKIKVQLESGTPTGIYIVRINKDRKQSTQRILVRSN
jgi:hypothetical protein